MARAPSTLAVERRGALEPGSQVNGFRVERVLSIGAGDGMLVQAAGSEGQRVALKLLDGHAADAEQSRQLARLARDRAAIHHPNLLPLVGAGEHEGRLYLVCELPEGETLAARLSEGPLPPDEAVRLMAGVAAGLEAAAAAGLVHAELSPESILIASDTPGRGLLGDFGTAPSAGGPHSLRMNVAGADYRSPEEIRGDPPTPQSNAYSLACVLFECLTGTLPYPYERPLLALHAHLVEPPPRPSKLRPGLPPELDEVFARAMAKEPDRRLGCLAMVQAAADALSVPLESAPPETDEAEKQTSRLKPRAKRVTRPAKPTYTQPASPAPRKSKRPAKPSVPPKPAGTGERTPEPKPAAPKPDAQERVKSPAPTPAPAAKEERASDSPAPESQVPKPEADAEREPASEPAAPVPEAASDVKREPAAEPSVPPSKPEAEAERKSPTAPGAPAPEPKPDAKRERAEEPTTSAPEADEDSKPEPAAERPTPAPEAKAETKRSRGEKKPRPKPKRAERRKRAAEPRARKLGSGRRRAAVPSAPSRRAKPARRSAERAKTAKRQRRAPRADSSKQRPRRTRGAEATERRRRSNRLRGTVAAVAIVALAGSALGGFLLGNTGSEDSPPPSTARPLEPKVPAAELARAEYVRNVSPAIDRLSARRTAARRRLQKARLPGVQAVTARRLVKAYADARRRVASEPPAPEVAAEVLAGLRSVERAYRRMAKAARNENRTAWRSAVRAAGERERRLESSLRSLSSA